MKRKKERYNNAFGKEKERLLNVMPEKKKKGKRNTVFPSYDTLDIYSSIL